MIRSHLYNVDNCSAYASFKVYLESVNRRTLRASNMMYIKIMLLVAFAINTILANEPPNTSSDAALDADLQTKSSSGTELDTELE